MATSGETPATGLYEPLLPPYQALSSTNRGPLVMLTAVTLTIITALTVIIKMQIILSTFRKLRIDDMAMIAAMIFAVGYTISICKSVQYGLGRVADDLTSIRVEQLSQAYYASNIMLLLSLTCAKTSVVLLIISIKPKQWVKLALYGVLAAVAAWGVASIFLVSFQCGPTRWVMGPGRGETCVDQYAMQIGVRVVDIAIDTAIVILPIFMMSSVQVPLDKRLAVMALFGLRAATPVFTAISLASLADYYDASLADRPFAAVDPAIWTTVALMVSIVTACIPSIKRFLADWAAGLSIAGISDPFEQQHSSGNKSNMPGYGAASAMRSNISRNTGSRNDPEDAHQNTYSYYTRRGKNNRSLSDSESMKALTNGVIMQTVGYTVEYEESSHDRDKSLSTNSRERRLKDDVSDEIARAV